MRTLVLLVLAFACGNDEPARPAPQKIRVAVVGGMMDTGLWPEIATRYERLTGHTVELAASGPKQAVVSAFRRGGIDLITVHASDAMVNLVADGLARDPQPWVRNDLVIVGPKSDPAGVRGMTDATAALKKIIAKRSTLLVHASQGADGVLHDIREDGQFTLDPDTTLYFNGENQREILQRAVAANAYTIVGRIPMLTGKLRADGIEILVKGDPKLRRPYLVEVSPKANPAAADLAAFLRLPETQAFIATFGKGKYDDQPLFFPVTL